MMHHDIVIIGGGPAGLAAAVSARRAGVEDIITDSDFIHSKKNLQDRNMQPAILRW